MNKNAIRKLLTVLLTLILVMSATACGGKKNTPTQTTDNTTKADQTTDSNIADTKTADDNTVGNDSVPASTTEPTDTDYDPDNLRSLFVEAYMGLTEDGAGVYYAGSADGSIALLMFLDADAMEHYVFVGPIVDNGGGSVTITDEEDGLTLTFSVTSFADGIVIDMGDELGIATLGDADVDEVIDAMLEIENLTTAVVPDSTTDLSYLNDVITEAYAGSFAEDIAVYIANNDDGSFMVLALLSPDTTESIIMVGSATADGNNITLTNESNGNELNFTVYDNGDGLLLNLDVLGLGETVVTPVAVPDMVTALETLVSETEIIVQ